MTKPNRPDLMISIACELIRAAHAMHHFREKWKENLVVPLAYPTLELIQLITDIWIGEDE